MDAGDAGKAVAAGHSSGRCGVKGRTKRVR